MILVKKKNLAFIEINKKYVNKKIYLDEEKFKTTVFSSLITMPRSFLDNKIFCFTFKVFFYLHNIALAYKLVYF